MERCWSTSIISLTVIGALALPATDASAIPASGRRTKLGCDTCHPIFPQLNRFARDFRDNGFRTLDEVESLLRKRSSPPTLGGDARTPPTEDCWSFIPDGPAMFLSPRPLDVFQVNISTDEIVISKSA